MIDESVSLIDIDEVENDMLGSGHVALATTSTASSGSLTKKMDTVAVIKLKNCNLASSFDSYELNEYECEGEEDIELVTNQFAEYIMSLDMDEQLQGSILANAQTRFRQIYQLFLERHRLLYKHYDKLVTGVRQQYKENTPKSAKKTDSKKPLRSSNKTNLRVATLTKNLCKDEPATPLVVKIHKALDWYGNDCHRLGLNSPQADLRSYQTPSGKQLLSRTIQQQCLNLLVTPDVKRLAIQFEIQGSEDVSCTRD